MIDYIKLCFAVFYPFCIGWIFISAIDKSRILLFLEKCALSYIIGFGILSLEMFLLGIFKISLITFNILIFSLVIALVPSYLSIKNKSLITRLGWKFGASRLSLIEIALLILIVFKVFYAFAITMIKPVINVDAFASWSLKAKVFFIEQSLMLDKSSKYFLGFGHMSYPLNLSLIETWIFNVLGYWNDQLVKVIFPLFFISLLLILYCALNRVCSRTFSLLGVYLICSLPMLLYHATSEYMDLPLSACFSASIFLIFYYFGSGEAPLLYISAILAGICTWTKTEGTPLIMVNIIILLIFFISQKQMNKRVTEIVNYLLIILVFKLPWSIFNIIYSIPKEPDKVLEIGKTFENLGRVPVIAGIVFDKYFMNGNWNIVWFIFIVLLILSFYNYKKLLLSYPLAVIFLSLGALLALYYFTGSYIYLIQGTTLNRNTLLVMPILIYFITTRISEIFEERSTEPKKK